VALTVQAPENHDHFDRLALLLSRIQNLFDWRQERVIFTDSAADGYEDVTELRAGIQRAAESATLSPRCALARVTSPRCAPRSSCTPATSSP